MIPGQVAVNPHGHLEPWTTIAIEDANGDLHELQAMIDTGFTGWLALPESTINALGLKPHNNAHVVLATGDSQRIATYFAQVSWRRTTQPIIVFQTTDQYLLGLQLLKDTILTMQVWDGGNISISEPPEP